MNGYKKLKNFPFWVKKEMELKAEEEI